MKKIFIFGTKLRMFLCELPLIFIMAVSIYFNPDMKTPGKLYPLIIAMAAGIIFMFIYLFRGVSISGEKIKSVGLFSSRDSIVVEKNQTLSLTLRPKNMLKIELYSQDDKPVFDWIDKSSPNSDKMLNIYRDIAVGGVGQIKRVLRALRLHDTDIEDLISSDEKRIVYANIDVEKKKSELGDVYSVHFKSNL